MCDGEDDPVEYCVGLGYVCVEKVDECWGGWRSRDAEGGLVFRGEEVLKPRLISEMLAGTNDECRYLVDGQMGGVITTRWASQPRSSPPAGVRRSSNVPMSPFQLQQLAQTPRTISNA